jgi:ribonuclease VapC
MVVDTSAIVAILLNEPDAHFFAEAIAAAPNRLVSAVARAELALLVEARKGQHGRADLELVLLAGAFEIAPVTAHHAEIAIEAFRRFGKGRHPAGLTIGDCFSYALAKASGMPLLFKRDDFARTDLPRTLRPQGPDSP